MEYGKAYTAPEDFEVKVRSRKPLNRALREQITELEEALERHNYLSGDEIISSLLTIPKQITTNP